MICVDDLTVHYGGAVALQGVSFTAEPGGVTALVGRNGAGKTTLLRTLAGTVAHRSGTITINGDVIRARPGEVARSGIRFVPESRNVFGDLSVQDNLLSGTLSLRPTAGKAAMASVLDQFTILRPLLERKARFLSGGERQSLAVARALVSGPSVLLLDEPSLGLSAKWARELLRLVARIASQRDLTVLIAEQNTVLVSEITPKLIALETGRVQAIGRPDEVAVLAGLTRLLDG